MSTDEIDADSAAEAALREYHSILQFCARCVDGWWTDHGVVGYHPEAGAGDLAASITIGLGRFATLRKDVLDVMKSSTIPVMSELGALLEKVAAELGEDNLKRVRTATAPRPITLREFDS